MRLLSLYLKTVRLWKEDRVFIREISSSLNYHESYLSKVERGEIFTFDFFWLALEVLGIKSVMPINNNINIRDYDNSEINRVMERETLKIKKYILGKINDYYINDMNSKSIEIELNRVDFPFRVLIEYADLILKEKYDDERFIKYEYVLLNICDLFNELEKKFFYVLYARRMVLKADYKEALCTCLKAKDLQVENVQLDFLIGYYKMQIDNGLRIGEGGYENYSHLKLLIKKQPNQRREIQLINEYSQFCSMIGDSLSTIKQLKQGIQMGKDSNKVLYEIMCYNLGWEYLRIKKYDLAIEYYSMSFPTCKDTLTYFELAWCYYCLNNKEKALSIVQESKDISVYREYSVDFNTWLGAMIHRPFSKRSIKILLHIYKKHASDMHYQSLSFLYMQLINFYTHHLDHEEALKYSILLNQLYL